MRHRRTANSGGFEFLTADYLANFIRHVKFRRLIAPIRAFAAATYSCWRDVRGGDNTEDDRELVKAEQLTDAFSPF